MKISLLVGTEHGVSGKTQYNNSQIPLYGHPLTSNTDTSLSRTVCFVPGERKPLNTFPKFNSLNTDTFYGPLSVSVNGVWLLESTETKAALSCFPVLRKGHFDLRSYLVTTVNTKWSYNHAGHMISGHVTLCSRHLDKDKYVDVEGSV